MTSASPTSEESRGGRVSRRLSRPDAAAMLWCGTPIESLVEGVARARASAPACHAPSNPDDIVEALRSAASKGPVLLDGSLAARALAGLRARGGGESVALDAAPLDLAAIFDAHVASADTPTVYGFEGAIVRALAGGRALVCARGGDELFGAGCAAQLAVRRSRPRLFRRRFAPADDALDVEAARRAEILGLDGAPIHRASSIRALLATQTRDAISTFGPRAIPGGLTRNESPASLFAKLSALGLDEFARGAVGVETPFAPIGVRELVEALPAANRFGRRGKGGLLARLAADGPIGATAPTRSFDDVLDAACRGPLRSRVDDSLALAARSVGFRSDVLVDVRRRFHAGSHGWTGRRVLTIALLARSIERDGLDAEPST